MKKIGLTGNIGSGKSLVCSLLERFSVPVYYADDEAKKILDSKEVQAVLKNHFGAKIFSGNWVNRQVLASIVFQSRKELEFLNNTIHPRLKEDIKRWFDKQEKCTYAVVEAAILFENSFENLFDKIVFVSAPKSIRLDRVLKRDKVKREDVLNRMKNQWAEEDKIKLSDYVIYNDDEQMLLPQLIELNKKLESLK
jgi:dephospho-CoA kinase